MKNNHNDHIGREMDRRRFLRLLGLAACSYASTGTPSYAEKRNAPHLVIIGGGIGGATAAKYMRLLNKEIRITIIEPGTTYLFCPGSNEILPGWKTVRNFAVSYSTLKHRYGIRIIHDKAEEIDYRKKRVTLARGGNVRYDKLIVSPGPQLSYGDITGYSKTLADSRFPAAWRLSRQTLLLRQQLLDLQRGGTVIISIPDYPYRCPPAPYERATFVAHLLKQNNPTAKLILLDAKNSFIFDNVYPYYWEKHFNYGKENALLEWLPRNDIGRVVRLDAGKSTLITENGQHFKGDIINIIPPEKAARFAFDNDLTEGNWCPVDYKDYTSLKQQDVYVIGDSIDSDPMPKTGYVASNQARVAIQAINDELHGREPGTPLIVNDCIALVEPGFGMTLSEIFRYAGAGLRLKARHYIPGVDRNRFQQVMLGKLAEDWQLSFQRSVFG